MKKNIKLVLLMEFLLLAGVIAVVGVMTGENMEVFLKSFLDIWSLAGIVLVMVPGLIIMGEGRDFIKAFSVGKKSYSLLELKNIIEAVSVSQKLVLYGGLIELIISFVVIFGHQDSLSFLGKNISVALLTGFYVVIFEYFLLPLKTNAVKAMNEEMDFDEQE